MGSITHIRAVFTPFSRSKSDVRLNGHDESIDLGFTPSGEVLVLVFSDVPCQLGLISNCHAQDGIVTNRFALFDTQSILVRTNQHSFDQRLIASFAEAATS